jgi:hypothetical protein
MFESDCLTGFARKSQFERSTSALPPDVRAEPRLTSGGRAASSESKALFGQSHSDYVDSKLKCPVFVASEMSGFGFCFR